MKAEDLRIGNWVKDDDGKPQQVDTFTFDTYAYEGVEPIPLDEEWIVRFGYKKVNTIGDGSTTWELRGTRFMYLSVRGVSIAGCSHKEVKYVHQLQNLYYALTNQELKEKKKEKQP